MLAGLIFGLAPAWQGSRGDIGAVLKEGGRSAVAGGARLRSGLLVAEVALSLVLLVGASLLLRSFASLTSVDPGFRPDNVLAFRVSLPSASYPEPHHRIAFYDRLLERLRTVPGVEAAGMVADAADARRLRALVRDRRARRRRRAQDPSANHRSVSAGYFAAAGIPLKRGRVFGSRDDARAPMVAVVDDAFAERHFAGGDPIGQRIDIGNGTDGFYEIVGVVGSVRHEGLDAAPAPTMYVPFTQDVFSGMAVLVRTAGDPAAYAGAARDVLREIDGTLPAFGMGPLAEVVTESVARRRFSMLLLSVFAAVALFLAAVGLYGVVAYTVSQRTQEIGVRMAIGADTGRVLRMIVGGGMKLALAGILVGIAGALALARYLDSLLYAVTPFDPASYAVTAALLLAVAGAGLLHPRAPGGDGRSAGGPPAPVALKGGPDRPIDAPVTLSPKSGAGRSRKCLTSCPLRLTCRAACRSLARSLVAAARTWTLYPPDHPAVRAGVQRFARTLEETCGGQPLALGVTPDTLLVGGHPGPAGRRPDRRGRRLAARPRHRAADVPARCRSPRSRRCSRCWPRIP